MIIKREKENEKWIFKLKNSCNKLSKVLMKNKYSKMDYSEKRHWIRYPLPNS